MYVRYNELLFTQKNMISIPMPTLLSPLPDCTGGEYSLNRSSYELEMIRGNHDKHSRTALSRNFAIDDFIHDAVSSPR